MASPRIADSVGRVLGDRYRLIRPLGVGASAHVYVADDVHLRRRVAIKLLHPALAGDEGFLRRFRAEAQVVASLRHPNILAVYDWGEDAGSPYLVMELLEGGSLRSLLDRGDLLSPEQAARVGADAARALDYAHRRGLVHRDIKPANLIFDDEGRVTVADFGLARALAEASWTEPAGAVVGTARYAAPEQVRGEKLDNRADVYSLAIVLVEATTGTVPFASDTTLGTLMARVEQSLAVPASVGTLAPVLEAAGTAEPVRRLDAAALAHALDRVAAKLPPPAPLPLSRPLITGRTERDVNPTEFPGRPKLFDAEQADDAEQHEDAGQDRFAVMDEPPVGHGAASQAASSPAGSWEQGAPPPRRRRRFRLLVLLGVVVLLAGAVGVAIAAERTLTPSHPVPSLVGDSTSAATAALRTLHLHLRVTGTRYDNRPAGTVISQDPSSGRLKEGQAVSVVVSKGPQPVAVPDLHNLTRTQALDLLVTFGLKLGKVSEASSMTVPAGEVIGSSPDQGTLLPGQAVAITLSSGKPTVAVPALTGSAAASFVGAKAALGAAGLSASELDKFSDTVPRGKVIGTSPPGGTSVTVGSTVSVIISKGPDLVAVPDVQGDSVGAADERLTGLGFSVSGVTGNPIGTVASTDPPAGTRLHRGAAVQIVTG